MCAGPARCDSNKFYFFIIPYKGAEFLIIRRLEEIQATLRLLSLHMQAYVEDLAERLSSQHPGLVIVVGKGYQTGKAPEQLMSETVGALSAQTGNVS